MTPVRPKSEREGFALVVVLLVLLAVGAISAASAIIGSNTFAIRSYDQRLSVLKAAADAGLEEGRARVNQDPTLYPDTGFVALETNASVLDAAGNPIPGVRRSIYVGPTGSVTGQYGVYGSVVSVAENDAGDRIVRRREMMQQSFARFAYFTNIEGDIVFGSGDQVQGPVHSNDRIRIHSSRATFLGPVTTASTIVDAHYGEFRQGYKEGVARIELPQTTDLNRLQSLAMEGGAYFVSPTPQPFDSSHATLRIEFVTRMLDGVPEGFFKVYQARNSNDAWWVVAGLPPDYDSRCQPGNQRCGMRRSPNCGDYHTVGGSTEPRFVSLLEHTLPGWNGHNWNSAANAAVCYLGGDDRINNGVFVAEDSRGFWVRNPRPVHPRIAATGWPDAEYLFPLGRQFNPDFKGVIFVEGRVAVSGVLRGRITLAARTDIIIADDLRYATDPGAEDRDCTSDNPRYDILGLFAGNDVRMANNTLNAQHVPDPPGQNYRSFNTITDETVHAVILALNEFKAANHAAAPTTGERCGTTQSGRGCLFLTGGIIQRRRGPVGLTSGEGYIKRYSYDQCAAFNPPPYFPTTGHFDRGHYFEVDPAGFDVHEYFRRLTSY